MDWQDYLKLFVPAALGIVTGWVSGVLAAEIKTREARATWRRSRQDAAASLLVSLLKDLVNELTSVSHQVNWLSWRLAQHAERPMSEKEFNDASWFMNERIPRLQSAHAALSSVRPRIADHVLPVVNDACDLAFLSLKALHTPQLGLDADLKNRLVALNGSLLPSLRGIAEAVLEVPQS